MIFKHPRPKYHGQVNAVNLGSANLPIGGQEAPSLYYFDGPLPNPARFSLDVWDYDPGLDWPVSLRLAFDGVRHDVGLWAQKCADYGADIVTLHLKSTDPNDRDQGPEKVVESVGRALEALGNVPLIVMGVDNTDRDVETLSRVAEAFSGRNLALGPVTVRNYKRLGAQALVHGHAVIALSPTDFNLAKQLNILLYGLGLPKNRLIMDPTAAALGYGMEYCYTVMEQLQIASLLLDDQDAQHPLISFFGEDVWKTKEAGRGSEELIEDGVMLEAVEAVAMLMAGASILGMRHPEAMKIAQNFLKEFQGQANGSR